MSVVIETTLGDITVDLFLSERPRACLNFLKLCKLKYYNYNLFHTISRGFVAQTGDPTGSRSGGESIFGILDGPFKRFFESENEPRIKHTKMGMISFVGNEERMIGSQFFLTLGEDLTYLDEKHCVFGEVVEGLDILEMINEVICDTDDRPYQDVRITHTVVLDDPYPDPKRLVVPSRSPSPSAERLQGGRIAPDEEIDEMEGKTVREITEMQAEREAKARATILEMVGDLPDADMAPPENVLFVCKLNPVTNDDDLEIIFSRFGKIKSCEVIRDKKTGDSLQYAFVEFENQKACEDAYFKMDNVLIDDRRIHVDFSQSVSKVKWHGKGRGVTHYDEKGQKSRDNHDIGKGNYKQKKGNNYGKDTKVRKPSEATEDRDQSKSRHKSISNEKNKSNKHYNSKRDRSMSPKRKRDFISPNRSETKYSNSHRSYRDHSRSTRSYKENTSQRREHGSSYNNEKYRDKNNSPRRSSDRKDKGNYKATGSSEKGSSRGYGSHDRREMSSDIKYKPKEKMRSYSDSEDEDKRDERKNKKPKHVMVSSDSDKKKKKKVETDSSDSSDSDYKIKTKKSKKKKSKKAKYDSDTDSDRKKIKKKKSKKKKRDNDSDSDSD